MKDFFLTEYAVKGIKTIKEEVNLSFYKKITNNDIEDKKDYNVKGIYGMNGSGKTAIISSVDILKSLLTNFDYLNNIYTQDNLEKLINKYTRQLDIKLEYITDNLLSDDKQLLKYYYTISLSKDENDKYVISKETLMYKKANSRSDNKKIIFEVSNGTIVKINIKDNMLEKEIVNKSLNLLSSTTFCMIFKNKILADIFDNKLDEETLEFIEGILSLFGFGNKLHAFLVSEDKHEIHLANNRSIFTNNDNQEIFIKYLDTTSDHINFVMPSINLIKKEYYKEFEEKVKYLYRFIHVFKNDLLDIKINKKDDGEYYRCELDMVYDSYNINVEYESTGIKKLIYLYTYINEVINGGIVFIDEFDSNLHDVYLCALLEFVMEYAKGQLCFTTHNVGPMDILKNNKKSIDFLSENNKIYSWTTNGHYSPSRLYKNGMIEGSPFNVDSFDFLDSFKIIEE